MTSPLWSRRPFKAAYITIFLVTTPPYLLFLGICYTLAKRLRPVHEWTVRQCLARAYLKSLLGAAFITRDQPSLPFQPGKSKDRFVLVEPSASDAFSGILASSSVKPASVAGFWYPCPPQDGNDLTNQDVILHFPGGSFVLPLGTEEAGQELSRLFGKSFKATTLLAQYRVARSEETRFPAAVQDALMFYQYILSLGIHPSHIILSGDSAGGNVALALLRYLETCQTKLPVPCATMFYSPAVYLPADAGRVFSALENADKDFLPPALCQWGADAYLPQTDSKNYTEATAFFSPLDHPFETKVPLFIQAGIKEALHGYIKTFAEQMSQVQGTRVELHESKLAPHDIVMAHKILGFTKEAEMAVECASRFFKQHTSSLSLGD
jgi:acetyl esterase/lipase